MVKAGYKKTEIGEIPEDWDVVPVSDITFVVTNGFVGKAKSHYTEADNGVLYIQGYNVEANSINFTGIKKVTPEFHSKHKKSCLNFGDLLTVQTGDVGLTTIVTEELVGCNCHALIISRFKKNKASPLFYAHYFNSPQGRLRLKDLEVGTTMKHINVFDLLDWKVPNPLKVDEQNNIAKALSDVDELIVSLDKLIAKKQDIKTATMQQLLTGKKRLPGFGEGKGYKQTELGQIPEDWDVKRLGEFGIFRKGKGIRKDQVLEDGLPCIRYGEIYTKHKDYIKEFYSFISTELAKEATALGEGDLLFAGSGETAEEIGKCVAFLEDCIAYAGGDIVIFSPQDQDSKFLGYIMNSQYVISQKSRMGQGDAVVHIHAHNLANLICLLPEPEEQCAISTLLSDMDMNIEVCLNKLSKAKALKQGMMQELLTGRTRLI